MKQNLKFLLALGDMKMVVLDSPARQEVYTRQRNPKAEQENSLRRIADALTAK
ncbi:MAG: hypothetical protein FWF35_00020 [Elusimicrobia bacterium]|nr:hypothetical protein [Elusimicrobiota bacterium]